MASFRVADKYLEGKSDSSKLSSQSSMVISDIS